MNILHFFKNKDFFKSVYLILIFFVSGLLCAKYLSPKINGYEIIAKPSVSKSGFRIGNGKELVFIFIGSYKCGACRDETLSKLIIDMKKKIKERIQKEGKLNFTSFAIGVDWDVWESIKWLNNFGVFDEVSVGRKWWNEGTSKYLWTKFPGYAATPSIVIVEREINIKDGYSIINEKFLLRKVGLVEIKHWYENGLIY